MSATEHGLEHKTIDIVISYDTTGSMSSAIGQVKRKVKDTINRLFNDIPGMRIGLVAHGDYCDEKSSYLMKHVDLTDNKQDLITFIETVGNTCGGDYPEAYEYVLREVQKFKWSANDVRALLMIGDAYPHEKNENPHKIDWRDEVDEIKKMGIAIYSIQALNSGNGKCHTFYKTMASVTNGYHLYLDQFSYINDMILAICYKQDSDETLVNFEQELEKKEYGLPNSLRRVFDTMLKRESTVKEEDIRRITGTKRVTTGTSVSKVVGDVSKLEKCPPAKYQILHVDADTSIKEYVVKNGLEFKTGKGFYEFTKTETISPKKHVVLQHKATGELFDGAEARSIIGLTDDSKRVKPTDNPDYRIFIQSTSYNRKLVGGTGFLYEANDFGVEDEE